MAVRHYSRDDLMRLRDSPHVQRPDDLPSIEQWIDESQQPQSTTGRRHQQSTAKATAGTDTSPMGNFGAGLRPSLVSRNTATKSGEDISLGPPRTMFPSSRNTAKVSDFADKTAAPSNDAVSAEGQEAPRSRFFGDRKSLHEKETRENRESWMSARERRGDDEHKQEGRFTKRERDHDADRRNGYGEKHDGRWSERRQNGERHADWRDRDRDKKDRDWDRGGQTEKEPEWMADPAPSNAAEGLSGIARNQEEFQRWKEAQSGKKTQVEDTAIGQTELNPTAKESAPPKRTETLKLEGMLDKPFGSWGESKTPTSAVDSVTTPGKSIPGKTKSSRFASMFKDSQKEDMPSAESNVQQSSNQVAKSSAEDEAGFNRILQMLGGTGIEQPETQTPSSPPATANSNGMKKSRFTGFFDQAAKSPERAQSPPEAQYKANEGGALRSRGTNEGVSMFGGRLPTSQTADPGSKDQTRDNVASPEPTQPPINNRESSQQAPGRMSDVFLDQQQPPSRGAATPDVNIQNLLASQRAQRPQGQDKQNSDFLLNLLQTKGSSRPPSQQQRPDNFPLWLDQPPSMPEPHAPKPRAPPPPGLFEDQLLRNTPREPPKQDQQQAPQMQERQRASQRAPPPGFFDEQSQFMMQQAQQQMQREQQQQQQAQQRRTFTEPPQQQHHQQPPQGRRMSGHPNLPQMQMPHQQPQPQPHQHYQGPPTEYLHSPQGAPGAQNAPPGFNPNVRHPPGFHNPSNMPNIFQQQQTQHPQSQRGDMSAGGAGGYPGQGMPGSPPNAPPGFFNGPPGMMPPPGFMQMRSPTEAIPTGARGRGYEGGGGGGFDGSMGGAPRR